MCRGTAGDLDDVEGMANSVIGEAAASRERADPRRGGRGPCVHKPLVSRHGVSPDSCIIRKQGKSASNCALRADRLLPPSRIIAKTTQAPVEGCCFKPRFVRPR